MYHIITQTCTYQSYLIQDNSFPKKIKDIEGSGYTIKLLITSRNVEKRDLSYIATDIVTGYNYIDESVQQKDSSMQTSTSAAEVFIYISFQDIIIS